MLGAPKGCIPLGRIEGFIAANQVGSVINCADKYPYFENHHPGSVEIFSGANPPPSSGRVSYLSPNKGILVSVGRETFYFEMSVQQFAARMVEALAELDLNHKTGVIADGI